MDKKKKFLPSGLFALIALSVSLLLLYSCKKEDEISKEEKKRQILENVLKDADKRIGHDSFDLITEGTYNGDLYYELWRGICFPGPPFYYNSNGDFFCSNYFWQEEDLKYDRNFKFSDTEIVYREAVNCFDEPPVNKYGLQLN